MKPVSSEIFFFWPSFALFQELKPHLQNLFFSSPPSPLRRLINNLRSDCVSTGNRTKFRSRQNLLRKCLSACEEEAAQRRLKPVTQKNLRFECFDTFHPPKNAGKKSRTPPVASPQPRPGLETESGLLRQRMSPDEATLDSGRAATTGQRR